LEETFAPVRRLQQEFTKLRIQEIGGKKFEGSSDLQVSTGPKYGMRGNDPREEEL
jgi:hypothetical protein